MDLLAHAKMKCLKKTLNQNCSNSNLEYIFDEKTGQLMLSLKQKNKKTDKSINSRFDILDL